MSTISRSNYNKGFTMVELIAAIGIGVVLASAVAGLIAFSVRMYSNQVKTTEIQKEIQTTLNQIEDSAVSASWFTYKNDAGKTKYVAFGKIGKKDPTDTDLYFFGEVFVTGEVTDGKFNIYMNRYSYPDGGLAVSDITNAKSQISSYASGSDWNDEKYLIASDATKFKVDYRAKPTPSPTPIAGTITNPISFDFEIEFVRSGMGKEIKKSVKDEATLRNHVEGTVSIDGVDYSVVLK